MLCVVMLRVVMLSVVMLNDVILNVVIINVIMLNVIMLNAVMLNVVMLNVVMLNVINNPFMLNVSMLSVVMPIVAMLSVAAPNFNPRKFYFFSLKEILSCYLANLQSHTRVLYHKTFYGRNLFRTVVNATVMPVKYIQASLRAYPCSGTVPANIRLG
jgi:hypothetical protein